MFDGCLLKYILITLPGKSWVVSMLRVFISTCIQWNLVRFYPPNLALWSCMFCLIKWRVQACAGITYKCDSVRWFVMNISERVTTAHPLDTQVYVWNLTTLRFPLVSRSASRNSPARLGSMLSCRRRASLPAPGRHRGRIPEWHTETRTDIKTVLQQAVSAGPPHAACWDEAGTGAGGAQPPELSAMSRTTEAEWGCRKPRGRCYCCPPLLFGL